MADDVKYDRDLMFIPDAAPFMKKTSKTLKLTYPNILHVTCLCHALHKIADMFPNIGTLVANGKKIFVKSQQRCQAFHEISPTVPLPPNARYVVTG